MVDINNNTNNTETTNTNSYTTSSTENTAGVTNKQQSQSAYNKKTKNDKSSEKDKKEYQELIKELQELNKGFSSLYKKDKDDQSTLIKELKKGFSGIIAEISDLNDIDKKKNKRERSSTASKDRISRSSNRSSRGRDYDTDKTLGRTRSHLKNEFLHYAEEAKTFALAGVLGPFSKIVEGAFDAIILDVKDIGIAGFKKIKGMFGNKKLTEQFGGKGESKETLSKLENKNHSTTELPKHQLMFSVEQITHPIVNEIRLLHNTLQNLYRGTLFPKQQLELPKPQLALPKPQLELPKPLLQLISSKTEAPLPVVEPKKYSLLKSITGVKNVDLNASKISASKMVFTITNGAKVDIKGLKEEKSSKASLGGGILGSILKEAPLILLITGLLGGLIEAFASEGNKNTEGNTPGTKKNNKEDKFKNVNPKIVEEAKNSMLLTGKSGWNNISLAGITTKRETSHFQPDAGAMKNVNLKEGYVGQFQLTAANFKSFAKEYGYNNVSKYTFGSPDFINAWHKTVDTIGPVKLYEQMYAWDLKHNVQPMMSKLGTLGTDLLKRNSFAIKSELVDIANQYGPNYGPDLVTGAFKNKDINKMTDKQVLDSILNRKIASVPTYFSGYTKEYQANLKKAFENQKDDLDAELIIQAQDEQAKNKAKIDNQSIINAKKVANIQNANTKMNVSQLDNLHKKTADVTNQFADLFLAGKSSETKQSTPSIINNNVVQGANNEQGDANFTKIPSMPEDLLSYMLASGLVG